MMNPNPYDDLKKVIKEHNDRAKMEPIDTAAILQKVIKEHSSEAKAKETTTKTKEKTTKKRELK